MSMKLIVLDRDGTLNRRREDYVASPDEWEALPGALEAVARLNQAGWHVVLATNQSGIGRGVFDMASLNAVHAKMHRQLAAVGARVDAVFFCPHTEADGCECRKPAPGLLLDISRRFGVAPAKLPVVGNALRHAQAGVRAGCPTHLLLCGALAERFPNGAPVPEFMAEDGLPDTRVHRDLPQFVDWWLAQSQEPERNPS